MSTILVSEIFGPTIQGEGALIGRPTVFVRTGACDYRCTWCDTLYAVLPEYRNEWRSMAPEEILDEVFRLSHGHAILVTMSGGNPALQPLESLLELGQARGLTFALETQGSVARPWFAHLDHLVLSPKPPSSGMAASFDCISACLEAAGERPDTVLKVVVFDDADYDFSRRVHHTFPQVPMHLQAGTDPPAPGEGVRPGAAAKRIDWLLACVTRDAWFDVVVLPQLHVLVWGHQRGV